MSGILNLKEGFSNKEAAETRKIHLRQNGTPSKDSDSPREFQSYFIWSPEYLCITGLMSSVSE